MCIIVKILFNSFKLKSLIILSNRFVVAIERIITVEVMRMKEFVLLDFVPDSGPTTIQLVLIKKLLWSYWKCQ